MKKHKKKIFLIITFLFLLQQCTKVNLIPSLVSNKKEYNYLSNKVSSENFTVNRISDKVYAFITYDTLNNYFIINDTYSKIKINAKGEVKIKIPHPSGELPYKTHYVFTDSTVCDLSKDKLEIESFYKIINPAKEKLEKKWIQIFKEYYDSANTVIYGNDDLIYLKIKEGWVLLHLSRNYFLSGDNVSERTFENYPAKYNKLVYLKDVETNTYSDWLPNSRDKYEEDKIDYLIEKIIKKSFVKIKKSETFKYTPIIAQFQGVGYYQLKKGNEHLRFKENGMKYPFQIFKSESYLKHYTIPNKFKTKTEVSFIKYSFPTNQNESKSQGYYLVKRK